MSDRELLEMAAKAAGVRIGRYDNYFTDFTLGFNIEGTNLWWNPLTDDGDAFRLAVKLGMSVWRDSDIIWCRSSASVVEYDMYASARRAIVLAAAEIGRNME